MLMPNLPGSGVLKMRSRTGFVIFVDDCLLFWQIKLQTDIATVTMEAEYNTISMAM
jgi:hypothetical protein